MNLSALYIDWYNPKEIILIKVYAEVCKKKNIGRIYFLKS